MNCIVGSDRTTNKVVRVEKVISAMNNVIWSQRINMMHQNLPNNGMTLDT